MIDSEALSAIIPALAADSLPASDEEEPNDEDEEGEEAAGDDDGPEAK